MPLDLSLAEDRVTPELGHSVAKNTICMVDEVNLSFYEVNWSFYQVNWPFNEVNWSFYLVNWSFQKVNWSFH